MGSEFVLIVRKEARQMSGFFYPTNLKYLYTVGLLSPHTLASSDTFSVPAINAGQCLQKTAGISSFVVWGLPMCFPLMAAFAIPERTLARIICNSNSENTPAIFRNAEDIASNSPLRQSIVMLPTITSRRCFSRMISIISHNCFVLRLNLLTSSVMMVSPSAAVSSSI